MSLTVDGPGGSDVPVAPDEAPELRVALADDLAGLAAGLEFTSDGRFDCHVPLDAADLLLIPPGSPARLRALRAQLPAAVELVVVDRKAACHPRLVADCLEAGAIGFVSGASYPYLVAQLDAIGRRSPSVRAPRHRSRSAP